MDFGVYLRSHFLLLMNHSQLLKLYLRNQLFLFFTYGITFLLHLGFKNFFGFYSFLKNIARYHLFDEQLLPKEYFTLKACQFLISPSKLVSLHYLLYHFQESNCLAIQILNFRIFPYVLLVKVILFPSYIKSAIDLPKAQVFYLNDFLVKKYFYVNFKEQFKTFQLINQHY